MSIKVIEIEKFWFAYAFPRNRGNEDNLFHKVKVLLMGTLLQCSYENNFKKDIKRFL